MFSLFFCVFRLPPSLRYFSSVTQVHAELNKRNKRFLALVQVDSVATFDKTLKLRSLQDLRLPLLNEIVGVEKVPRGGKSLDDLANALGLPHNACFLTFGATWLPLGIWREEASAPVRSPLQLFLYVPLKLRRPLPHRRYPPHLPALPASSG